MKKLRGILVGVFVLAGLLFWAFHFFQNSVLPVEAVPLESEIQEAVPQEGVTSFALDPILTNECS
ncbi:MAG: hypothetical protein ACP5GX_05380, partial [Anaerolineae bacterium]